MTTIAVEMGERIKTAAGLTKGIKWLAKEIGTYEANLYRYIRGETKTTVETLLAISDATGASFEWLATGKGEMLPGSPKVHPAAGQSFCAASSEIGSRIFQMRSALHLSQQKFAKQIGISSGYISELENNKKVPGGEVLLSLKKEFCINIDWLLTGKGEMFRDPSKDIAQGVDFSVTIAGKKYVGKLHEMPD